MEAKNYDNVEIAFADYIKTSEYNRLTTEIYAMLKTAYLMGWLAAGGPLPGMKKDKK